MRNESLPRLLGGLRQERVYHDRKFDTVEDGEEAGDRAGGLAVLALPRRFSGHSIGEWKRRLQCAVCHQNSGHIEHTFLWLYCKIIVISTLKVVTDVMLKYSWLCPKLIQLSHTCLLALFVLNAAAALLPPAPVHAAFLEVLSSVLYITVYTH